jgi:hypothetical protein
MLFDSWIDITTIKSYTAVWRQLLYYAFQAENDELSKQLLYRLIERQQVCIYNVQSSV